MTLEWNIALLDIFLSICLLYILLLKPPTNRLLYRDLFTILHG